MDQLQSSSVDYFQRFLKTLPFLLNKNVVRSLSYRFKLSAAYLNISINDSVTLCRMLKEKGIISPNNIKPLTRALHDTFHKNTEQIVEDLFKLYQNGKLDSQCASEIEEDYFQRFLKSLSFSMNKKVIKDLSDLFAISDADMDTFGNDSVTFCKNLREVGIISPNYVTPLTLALHGSNNIKIGKIVEDLFRLFQDGKLYSQCAPSRKEEDYFQRFLKSLSFSLNKNVVKDLSDLFVVSDADMDTFGNDSVAFCKMLREVGIISPNYVSPLMFALHASDNDNIGRIVEDLFRLFQGGKLYSQCASPQKEDYFQRFLKSLSFCLNKNVVKDLSDLFAISDADMDTFCNNSVAFCKNLREVGIISPKYVTPLMLALHISSNGKIVRIVEDLFELFQDEKLYSQCASPQKEDYFQRFLKSLSFVLNTKVVKDLSGLFSSSGDDMDNFGNDSVAFCRTLREAGIISPNYVTPLLIALSESCYYKISGIVWELFKIFQNGKLDSQCASKIEEDNFQRFLKSISFSLNKKVLKDLLDLFAISDADMDTFAKDSVAFCTNLREVGIISPNYITPLTLALRDTNNKMFEEKVEELFRLFKNGKLDSPCASKIDEGEDFQQFLKISSLLIAEDMKQQLAAFFYLSDIELERAKKANMSFCHLLAQRQIICPENFELLKVALLEESKYMLIAGVEELFQLYQDGKLISSPTSEVIEDDDFDEFLDCLSLLISADVRQALASFFKFSPAALEAVGNDKKAFCIFLKEQRIIDRAYITPLKIALHKEKLLGVGQCAAIYFSTYRRKIQSSKAAQQKSRGRTTYGENKEQSNNGLFVKNLVAQEKGPTLADVKSIQIASSKHEVQSMRYRAEENTQGSTQSIDDNDANNDEAQDSEMEEGPSPEDVESIQITSSKDVVQPMMHHAEENTQGSTQSIDDNDGNNYEAQDSEMEEGPSPEDAASTQITSSKDVVEPMVHHAEDNTQGIAQSIDENVGNNDKEQDLETVPLDIVKELKVDFRQHQRETAIDTDDSTDEDEELFSRAGGSKCLEATASISKEGGVIRIPNTEIELQIQPNSFLRDDEIHPITVKILPRRLFDEAASCFEDHSTVMVEILPNNLKLQRAAKLTLPHCLILRDPKNCDVQIFHSHHNPDQLPQWEDITTSVQHELSANVCHIWIENFSWIKYNVGGKEIEGKKLFVYTLGKRYTRNSKFVTAEVGYFPALPGNDKIKLEDADFITSSKGTRFESKLRKMFQGDWQTFVFWKEPKTSLQISVSEINPDDGWKSSSTCPKYISYQDVEISNEQSQPFTFKRQEDEAPFPVIHFKVCQGEKYSEIYVDMEEGLIQDELQVATDQQRKQDKNNTQLTVQTDNAQCNSHEISVSEALRPVNEAKQVHETEMILSPNGEIAIKDHRQEAITLYQPMSTNAAIGLSNHFQAWGPSQRRVLQPQLLGPQEKLPILSQLSPSDIAKLSSHLDADHPLGMDWRKLADALGFNCGNTWNFKRNGNPTETVIMCACQSGKLRTKDQLLQVLEDMGRVDARLAISDRPNRNSSE